MQEIGSFILDQLLKMQSLNEQLVNLRRKMFGRSSEKVQYVDGEQLDFFNEAEACSDAGAPEPGKRHRSRPTLVKKNVPKPS